jgi:hypothetical protein
MICDAGLDVIHVILQYIEVGEDLAVLVARHSAVVEHVEEPLLEILARLVAPVWSPPVWRTLCGREEGMCTALGSERR